ncbi:MAG: alpha-L-fucosidase [Armatimonadetes bacterium]|nr:alpha-L-fucosidase [Armatimonadota bacterium]
MMQMVWVAAAVTLLVASACCMADDRSASPRPASAEEMQWWRDAKLGLFIHWGPASVRGVEISWARIGHPFDHHGHETVPAGEYDQLYKRFDPEKLDADKWMRMAKQAGCKYVVFITKHHDGFCLWPTKQTDYNITNTPYKRDICRQIADAAHRHGLKLGWYYSTRDWTHPDYLHGDNSRYNDYYHAQIEELLTNYGKVDILWFDHVSGNWGDYRFRDLFRMIYRLQPHILVNNRAARFVFGTKDQPEAGLLDFVNGDYETPEQQIGAYHIDRAWESCMTMTECKDGGGWSYRPDGRTRDAAECIKILVSTVTGDGNLLLNVGPMPTGEIMPDQVEHLAEMGAWMKQYGGTLYGTRGGPIPNGAWGGATRKGDRVWLHLFPWQGETLTLPALPGKVASVKTLTGGQATVTQTADGTVVTIAAKDRHAVDTIVELRMAR